MRNILASFHAKPLLTLRHFLNVASMGLDSIFVRNDKDKVGLRLCATDAHNAGIVDLPSGVCFPSVPVKFTPGKRIISDVSALLRGRTRHLPLYLNVYDTGELALVRPTTDMPADIAPWVSFQCSRDLGGSLVAGGTAPDKEEMLSALDEMLLRKSCPVTVVPTMNRCSLATVAAACAAWSSAFKGVQFTLTGGLRDPIRFNVAGSHDVPVGWSFQGLMMPMDVVETKYHESTPLE